MNGTRELIGVNLRLTDPTAILFRNAIRQQSWGYLGAEMAWYLEGSDSLHHLQGFAPSYGKFSDDGTSLYGAYGPRGLSHTSLVELCDTMRAKGLESRQFVVPVWRPRDLHKTSKDIPCTVALHFLVRNGLVFLTTFMRSNDLNTGFIYDVPCFCLMQQFVASCLGLGLGFYTHCVGSLHIYDKDLDALQRVVQSNTFATFNWADFDYSDANHLRSKFTGASSSGSKKHTTSVILEAMGKLRDYHRRA